MTRGSARLAVPLLCLLVFAGCAPGPRPGGVLEDDAARWSAARARREACLDALTADLVLRLDGRATGRIPALSASLALASPDRARIRARAILGLALDACARGDSLVVWVPSERVALTLGGANDSLSIGPPVALFARALGATWDPPRAAWRDAVRDSDGTALSWLEGRDSLALSLDRDGRARSARLARAGTAVRVRYTGWGVLRGEAFPSRLELLDETGWARLRVEVEQPHVQARPSASWFALEVPGDAKRLDWEGVRDMIDSVRGKAR